MAVNVALFCPAPIFTLSGIVTLVLLLRSEMLTAPGVAPVSATVQVEAPGAFTVPGEQFKLLS